MNTTILNVSGDSADDVKIEAAGNLLKEGKLVAFPTETVYGLGGDALNPTSSQKIYAAKGRPSDNPLIVHIYRFEDIEKITSKVPEEAKKKPNRLRRKVHWKHWNTNKFAPGTAHGRSPVCLALRRKYDWNLCRLHAILFPCEIFLI